MNKDSNTTQSVAVDSLWDSLSPKERLHTFRLAISERIHHVWNQLSESDRGMLTKQAHLLHLDYVRQPDPGM